MDVGMINDAEPPPPDEAASDVRHRNANTLQLLATLARMRGQKAVEAEQRRMMIWMAESIGALGALERQRTPSGLAFSTYLQEMAQVWRRRPGGGGISVSVEAAPILVRDQTAPTLALIVNELVANALQHGSSDSGAVVNVRLGQDGESLRLVVEDDGPGPPMGILEERFGLWLVRSLAAQIRGIVEVGPGQDRGFRASLRFPQGA